MREEGDGEARGERRKPKIKSNPIDESQAERGAIGYALLFPKRFTQLSILHKFHFGEVMRAEVWEIIKTEIEVRGSGITLPLIAEAIARRGLATLQAASDLLIECRDEAKNAPDPETAGYTFRDQILDYAFRRKTREVAAEMIEEAGSPVSLDEVKAGVQGSLFDLLNFESASSSKTLEQAMQDEFDRLDQQVAGEAPGLLSGIDQLDEIWNGACPGDMVVIAARPSVGKTSLGTQIALNLILPEHRIPERKAVPGAIWTLEMPKQQLIRRLGCQLSRLNLHNIGRNEFRPGDKERFVGALKRLEAVIEAKQFMMVDAQSIDGRVRPKTITDIVAEVRHWRNRMEIKWVMIDYLQKIVGIRRRGETRELEVARTSLMLKQMAQELEIPVFCLAQLRRPDKDRLKKRPTMNDIRESGSIEQDADAVIFIHNWDYVSDDKPTNRAERENAEIIVGKYRNGRTGRAEVDFRPPCQWFEARTLKGDQAAHEDPTWENKPPY